MSFECTRCGACCLNPLENEAEGFRDWVEIERDARLLRRRDLVAKLVVSGRDERPHLRLDHEGRCLALRGRLGHDVRCSIYALRPAPCRRVQAGDRDCVRYRSERGLDPLPAGERPRVAR